MDSNNRLPTMAAMLLLVVSTSVEAADVVSTSADSAVVAQFSPELAPGGTVILRGSVPSMSSSPSANSGSSGASSSVPTPPAQPGWDGGGFDRRFDRSGLSPQ